VVSEAVFSTSECAALLGCQPSTWRSLVSRRQAPPPLPDRRSPRGESLWDARVFLLWMAVRPGRGNHETGRKRFSPQVRTRPWSQAGSPVFREKAN
jgi:hypothetical protein